MPRLILLEGIKDNMPESTQTLYFEPGVNGCLESSYDMPNSQVGLKYDITERGIGSSLDTL